MRYDPQMKLPFGMEQPEIEGSGAGFGVQGSVFASDSFPISGLGTLAAREPGVRPGCSFGQCHWLPVTLAAHDAIDQARERGS